MKRRFIQYIFAFLLLLFMEGAWASYAQSRSRISANGKDRRTFALGSGGTNFSNRGKDKNGLYRSIYSGTHFFFGAWIDGAYSSFSSNISQMNINPGGEAFSGGVVIEYQKDIFRLQVGTGIRWQNVDTRIWFDTTFVNPNAIDSKGYQYTLQYDFNDRVDGAQTTYGVLPISAGVGFYDFYFNLGLKLEYPLWGSHRSSFVGSTTGTYDQFLGVFHEMDNHGLRKEVPMTNRYDGLALRQSIDVQLSAELGYEWAFNTGWVGGYRAKNKHFQERLRIAVFAEYGLTNIVPNSSLPLLEIPDNEYKWDFPTFQFNHILTTNQAENHFANKFYAGVRLVFLIGLKTSMICRLCGAYQSEADM